MDRTVLIERNAAVKVASCGKQVHPRLAVVTFVRIIYFCVRYEKDLNNNVSINAGNEIMEPYLRP